MNLWYTKSHDLTTITGNEVIKTTITTDDITKGWVFENNEEVHYNTLSSSHSWAGLTDQLGDYIVKGDCVCAHVYVKGD